jgi:sporulation protein YlmC with PRC-barrel domain
MNPSRLNGMKVFGAEGFVLGEVEGVDVDLNAWKVSTLHVSLNDEAVAGFGLDKPFMSKITVCLPIKIVKSVGDVVFLNKSVVNLDEVARECLSGPTKLAGKRVMGANGYSVGDVESLDLDPDGWKVTSLLVSLSRDAASELGLSKSFLSKTVIAIPAELIDLVGNMIILNENIVDLKVLAQSLESGAEE